MAGHARVAPPYLADLRKKQAEQAAAYGWVDQKAGVVQLPIRRGRWSSSSWSTGAPNDHEEPKSTPTDCRPRERPLLFLLAPGSLWLVISGALALLAAVQLHSPGFLAECPFLTYGRTSAWRRPPSSTAGWRMPAWRWPSGSSAAWPASRCAPRTGSSAGAWFWNSASPAPWSAWRWATATGFALLGLPGYVQLMLLFSYAAIAVAGLLAWSGRLRQVSYAAQWYAAAALFLFPWILSIAHVMLFSAPVRGVVQAIVAAGTRSRPGRSGWRPSPGGGLLRGAEGHRRVLPSYEFAALGFWCLIFVGGLTGGRHLLGGPVPAWIPSVAVVSCAPRSSSTPSSWS